MKDFDPTAYVEAAARAIDLELPENCKSGLSANLARLAAMAETLFAFPIPPSDARDTPDDA